MIFGIGSDIVKISRMEKDLQRWGERFAQRVLTRHELQQYQRSGNQANFLAKRFAAKEAVAKAFGCGFREGLAVQHIGVINDELGKPHLEFHGRAAQLLTHFEITRTHITLSDEDAYAIAFVVLETNG